MISHFLRAAEKPPIACSYINTYTSTTNATTYTFSSCSIGTASEDRYVVVLIMAEAGGTRTASSVTIGGVTANLDYNGSAVYPVLFAKLNVTTGTTADIVVTMSNSVNNMAISVYTLTGLTSSEPVESLSAATTGTTATISNLDVRKGGVVIAGASSAGTGTYTLSGVTEQYDATVETRKANGYSLITSTSTAYSVSSTSSASQNTRLVAVSWR